MKKNKQIDTNKNTSQWYVYVLKILVPMISEATHKLCCENTPITLVIIVKKEKFRWWKRQP